MFTNLTRKPGGQTFRRIRHTVFLLTICLTVMTSVWTDISHASGSTTTRTDPSAAATTASVVATTTETDATTTTSTDADEPGKTVRVSLDPSPYGTLEPDADRLDVRRGDYLPDLPEPQVEPGYLFLGWSLDKRIVLDPTTVQIEKPTKLFAIYESRKITVRFDPTAQGTLAEDLRSVTVPSGGSPQQAPAPQPQAGMTFRGWSLDGQSVVDPTSVSITEPTVFIALYEKIAHTVQLDPTAQATLPPEQSRLTVPHGDLLPALPSPTPAVGYQFLGWSVDGTAAINPAQLVVDRDLRLVALLKPIEHTVVFDPGLSATLPPEQAQIKVLYGSPPAAAPSPTPLTGYQFLGWSLDGTAAVDPMTTTITADTVFKALVKPIDYTVFFDPGANGTLAEELRRLIVPFGAQASAPPLPQAAEGYRFVGWSLDGQNVADPTAATVSGDVLYRAIYEQLLLTVTFLVGPEGTLNENMIRQTIPYGQHLPFAPTPEARLGYRFAGWTLQGDQRIVPTELTVTADTTLRARFEAVYYEVVFDAGAHGNLPDSDRLHQVQENAQVRYAPHPATDSGYRFLTWQDENGQDVDPTQVTILRPTRFLARYEAGNAPVPPVASRGIPWWIWLFLVLAIALIGGAALLMRRRAASDDDEMPPEVRRQQRPAAAESPAGIQTGATQAPPATPGTPAKSPYQPPAPGTQANATQPPPAAPGTPAQSPYQPPAPGTQANATQLPPAAPGTPETPASPATTDAPESTTPTMPEPPPLKRV